MNSRISFGTSESGGHLSSRSPSLRPMRQTRVRFLIVTWGGSRRSFSAILTFQPRAFQGEGGSSSNGMRPDPVHLVEEYVPITPLSMRGHLLVFNQTARRG